MFHSCRWCSTCYAYRWSSTCCESIIVPFLSMMFNRLWICLRSIPIDDVWPAVGYFRSIPIDDVRPAVGLLSFNSYRWCSTCCGSIFVPFLSIMFDLLWVYFRSIPIMMVDLPWVYFRSIPIYDVRPAVSLSVFHSYQWCSTCRGSIFVPVLPYPLGPLNDVFSGRQYILHAVVFAASRCWSVLRVRRGRSK